MSGRDDAVPPAGASEARRREVQRVSQARFQKMQREKQRRERAAAKFARKQERRENAESQTTPIIAFSEEVTLAQLADLHARFDAHELTFEEFELAKSRLTEQLDVR
jgi:hypothetical protein